MSATRRPGVEIAAVAVLIALALTALLASGRDRATDLDASVAGTDGLAIWLADQGLPARAYDGRGEVRADHVGLRVLPLYDAVPDRDAPAPLTAEALIALSSERDVEMRQVSAKLRQHPTLAVLPKWRAGMRILRAAHPDLLIEASALNAPVFDALRAGGKLRRPDAPLAAPYAPALTARIHLPQVIAAGPLCTPIIGTRDAMLLGRCRFDPDKNRRGEDGFWLLTDPDLLNNHGLTQGDNAAIVAAWVASVADGGAVIVDQAPEYWTVWAPDAPRDREWSDLAPLFAPPFSALWLGLGGLAALMIWRGAVRFGAPLPEIDGRPGASRAAAVDATARLLRLSGHDGALLAAWAEQRLARAATALLGPHRKTAVDPGAQLTAWLARRAPDRAAALDDAIAAIRAAPPETGPAGALRLLEEFEAQLEQVLHDAGRTASRRRRDQG